MKGSEQLPNLADQHIAGIFKFIKPVFAAEFGEAVRKKSPTWSRRPCSRDRCRY
jgi:hypothetical protein